MINNKNPLIIIPMTERFLPPSSFACTSPKIPNSIDNGPKTKKDIPNISERTSNSDELKPYLNIIKDRVKRIYSATGTNAATKLHKANFFFIVSLLFLHFLHHQHNILTF